MVYFSLVVRFAGGREELGRTGNTFSERGPKDILRPWAALSDRAFCDDASVLCLGYPPQQPLAMHGYRECEMWLIN